jgi:seryl-tRNA synthetase
MSGADNISKIEQLQKKCTALYADMKRQERELQKQKKRADALQKEKDNAKSELSKAMSMKEKLEKLSRETNNENRKLRVCYAGKAEGDELTGRFRPTCNDFKMWKQRCVKSSMNDWKPWCSMWRTSLTLASVQNSKAKRSRQTSCELLRRFVI